MYQFVACPVALYVCLYLSVCIVAESHHIGYLWNLLPFFPQSKEEREKGNDAYKKLNFTEAHQHYDNAILLDLGNAMLHWNKAAVFISEKNYEMAKQACGLALHLAQQDPARFGQQDTARLYHCFVNIIVSYIQPSCFCRILARLGKVEFLSGKPDVALVVYQQSLGLHHDPKAFAEMTKCQEAILKRRRWGRYMVDRDWFRFSISNVAPDVTEVLR